MTPSPRRSVSLLALVLIATLLTSNPARLSAQAPWLTPFSSRDSQRNALNQVRGQVKYLENATRTASSLVTAGYDVLGQRFQALCAAYDGLKRSLVPGQLDSAANEFAELDAGLGIIGEAFGIYRQEMDDGRSSTLAFQDLCQALRDGSHLWLGQLNQDCSRLGIGRR